MMVKIAQVIGLNTDQKAAQVYSTIADESNAFFALLNIKCDDAFTRGRQTLSEVSDIYFDFDGTPAQKLNKCVSALSEKLTDCPGFDFILASLSGKVLYVLGSGNVEIYLKREAKISQLLSVGAPSDLISGFLQPGDRVLFATKNLTTFLADDLSAVLSMDLEVFEEDISERVSLGDFEEDGLSGLLVEIPSPKLEISDEEKENIQGVFPENILTKEKFKINFNLNYLDLLKKLIPRTNKGRLIIGVILIVIILIGIGFRFIDARNKEKKAKFDQLLGLSKTDFDMAKTISSINPAEAKVKLETSKDNLKKALEIKSNNVEALEFQKKIESESGSILQQFSVFDFPLFLDLDLVKAGFSADKMSVSGQNLLLLDFKTKTLVAINLEKKSNTILSGKTTLGEAKLASLNGAQAFVLSEDKGIIKVDIENKKAQDVVKIDPDWGSISDIVGFGGNIYLLDTLKSAIWKYIPTETGYSLRRGYLTEGTKPNFINTIRMQIESSVYVLKADGEMLRFTKGEKDNFGYEGLPSNIKDPKSFFTSSDSDDLYILDSGNSRLLILTKTGEYKGEINGEKFRSATDLVVDEVGKKVYLLEGSKIYSIELK